MRSYLYTVERAIILVAAVVLAVLDAAVDTMVCLIVVEHLFHLKMICAGSLTTAADAILKITLRTLLLSDCSDRIIICINRISMHRLSDCRYDIKR